ncbi:hypothetical protein BKA80DRAFT_260932 [Phyllosticta citrichinensis]
MSPATRAQSNSGIPCQTPPCPLRHATIATPVPPHNHLITPLHAANPPRHARPVVTARPAYAGDPLSFC